MIVAQTGPRGASFLKNREKLLAVELAWDHRTHPSGNADERGLFEQRTHTRHTPIQIYKRKLIRKFFNKMNKVHIINLGCARNLVDSQQIISTLKGRNCAVTDINRADTVIVNTCAFVEDAKRESIDMILDLLELKKEKKIKKVVIAGCLAQRYSRELAVEFKDADAIIGAMKLDPDSAGTDVRLTPNHYAYLKICESCFNCCTYCVIPSIKGKFVSRSMDSVLEEAKEIEAGGVREINVIGQDITAYGIDLYKDKCLSELLRKLCAKIEKVEWIRLLYTYPSHITDSLIDTIANEPKICKYIDVPLQHINDTILKKMNRNMPRREIEALISKLRKNIPGVGLRTTFIVGFPGETEEQFKELLDFVKAVRFERLGVFPYSREEGTPAYDLPWQLPDKVKRARVDAIMKVQQEISAENNQAMVGRTIKVMIDEPADKETGSYFGRSEYDAPEVDCGVLVNSARTLRPGDFVDVKIKNAFEYDIEGDVA